MNEEQKKELRIQQDMWRWYNNKYCLSAREYPNMIAHVPNENQQHLIAAGLLPGFSDLIICHWSNRKQIGIHIYVEVKTPTGKQSPNQIKFQQRMERLGHEYYLVRYQKDFENLILSIDNRENDTNVSLDV